MLAPRVRKPRMRCPPSCRGEPPAGAGLTGAGVVVGHNVESQARNWAHADQSAQLIHRPVGHVDCIDNDTIAKKAAENPGAIGRKIPHIDWVWTQGKTLRSCIPADTMFDYGVATHVMEHVPDTVGWLNQILEVMRDGAVLALALPDRRYTMDYYRKETTLGDVVGNWMHAPSRPTSAQIVDFLSQSFYDTREGGRRFDLNQPFATAPRHYTDEQALEFAANSHRDGNYLDVHCTV